jgi:acetolactate synthase-1/2/3 large subunit
MEKVSVWFEQSHKKYLQINEKNIFLTSVKRVRDEKQLSDEELDLITSSTEWLEECKESNKAPKVLQRHRDKKHNASVYAFIEQLSKVLPKDHHVVTSDGSANVVTMQVMDLTGNQRLITNTGCAPMGYGLPAAIGAAIHNKIVCIEGDGSLHLNIHELQTMKHYNLPIKLIVINNDGYLSIKVSQKTFFNGNYVASEKNSGVSFPNYEKVIKAYDLPYYSIKDNDTIQPTLNKFLSQEGPCVLEIFTDPDEFHEPKVVAKLDAEGKFIPGELSNIQWIE